MSRYLFVSITLFLSIKCFGFQQNNFSAFVYHRFGDDRYPSTNISLQKFEEQLKYLEKNKVVVLTMEEALNKLKSTTGALQSTTVITIDDAYKSFYEKGWPLLKKHGFQATLFVNTETVGSGDFMSWEQIKEVSQAGIEIGNHSHAHPYFLDNFDIRNFKDDLTISHAFFRKMLGKLPNGYAYPYGEWNKEMGEVLESLGYHYGTAQNSGPIYTESPRFHLPRFPMSNDYAELNAFKQKLTVGAIEVSQVKVIEEGHLGSKRKPRLLINFNEAKYDLRNLQCFIQGAKANKSIKVVKDSRVELSVWPETDLTKRRTLFTITVTDHKGDWHWFSFVYVQAKPGQ